MIMFLHFTFCSYKMAENIDTQLKRMMLDIKDIINHINTSNANTKENEDPVSFRQFMNVKI